jgi:signal transduction histidine kinase
MSKKVLIVDDKPENLFALEKLLDIFEIAIIKAFSGNEALSLTLEHDFALALIDVQMPEMDGYETVKLLRNIEKTRYLPVIFISAIYSENQYLVQGIEAGAVDFIMKPIQPKILQGKVKIFLELYEERKKLESEIEQRKKIEASLREAETELILAKEKAIEADKLKTAFLANMSHEIRTPLNAIVGFSGLLAGENLDNDRKNMFIEIIRSSSDSLAQLINDILDIAKIEAGQLQINKGKVNIIPMLNEIFMAVSMEINKQEKQNIQLALKTPDKLSSYFIETDGVRLKQVITNLINNSIKFTLQGSIVFGFELIENNRPEFFVSDTGVGIPEDKLDIVFDRFQQVYNENIPNTSGTGLGLSIVKKIVELLGGQIYVTSKAGKGSSFFFTINTEFVDILQHDVKIEPDLSVSLPDFNEEKILVAEDEHLNFILLREILSSTGATVEWAKNGKDAIDEIKMNNNYCLVLVDIKMPIVDGYETFTEIRKIDKDIPIVAQTAYAMSGERDAILKYGFNDYISKPINKEELFLILKKYSNSK